MCEKMKKNILTRRSTATGCGICIGTLTICLTGTGTFRYTGNGVITPTLTKRLKEKAPRNN